MLSYRRDGLVDIECQMGVETQVEFLVPILGMN